LEEASAYAADDHCNVCTQRKR